MATGFRGRWHSRRAVAADVEQQTPRHHAKKSRLASKKPDAAAESNAESKDAGKGTKPGKHADAKPDAAPKASEKPAATTDKPAAKPAKPKKPARKRSGSKGSKSNAWRKYVVSNAPLPD